MLLRDIHGDLIVESDLSKAVAWVSNWKNWKFQFLYNEIQELSSTLNVAFCLEFRSSNFMVDA